jgi:hypothetical protein
MPDNSTYLAHLCMCDTCRYHRYREEERKGLESLEEAVSDLVWTLRIHPWLWNRGDGEGGFVSEMIREFMEQAGFSGRLQLLPVRREVERLAHRDGWDCAYCGCALDGKPDRPRPHVDHVIPKSRGGSNSITNKVLSCPRCNLSKGARTPEEWREAMAKKEQANG